MALSMDVPRAQARAVMRKNECHLTPSMSDGSNIIWLKLISRLFPTVRRLVDEYGKKSKPIA